MCLALFPDPNVQHQLHKTGLGKCLFSQILNGTPGILSFIPLCLSLQTLLGINWHSGFPGPANSCTCSKSLLYNTLSWPFRRSKKVLEKKNGSISAFCFSRSRHFQQQQQAGMCWQPTYRLHKLKCADKLLTMATRIKKGEATREM